MSGGRGRKYKPKLNRNRLIENRRLFGFDMSVSVQFRFIFSAAPSLTFSKCGKYKYVYIILSHRK